MFIHVYTEISMTDVVLDIKRWGNNLGVRIPASIARAARLHVDQSVKLTVHQGQVIITPLEHPFPSLAQRLAQFDPDRHGGEAMTSHVRLGAEHW